MNEIKYLLDTVSIKHLSITQLKSEVVQNNCFVPDEIIYELRNSAKKDIISELYYEIDINVLSYIKKALIKIDKDEDILDLYNNSDNGDIILIAIALLEIETNGKMLTFVRDTWKIVTEDINLKNVAESLGVGVLSTQDFINII